MFKIGDIVRPKEDFMGHEYCFQITNIKLHPFDKNSYSLQGIEQELDPKYGPASKQLSLIKAVEFQDWKEDEIELTSSVKLRYGTTEINVPEINVLENDGVVAWHKLIKDSKNSNKINKEEKEMEILDLYEERKLKSIREECFEKENKIKEEDEIQSIILEMTNQVNAILESQGETIKYEYHPDLITSETQIKLDELEKAIKEEIETLRSTLREIRALFELTDDYNERIKILKKYGILNKDGKLNV